MKDISIFSCSHSAEEFTNEICDYLEVPVGKIDYMKFKNDNNFIQLLETVRNKAVYLIQTVEPPINERIMELLIVIDAVKRASSKKINVILPYFPYSRSDKKDQPGVPVTAKLMAQLLESAGADRIITCDLHNPAIQAYFNIQCDRLTGDILLQKYFKDKEIKNMVVVATDAGSSKKAYKYSEYFKCPMALIDKRRMANDDNAVAVNIIGDVKNKTAIIFDDEISTGGTILEAAKIVKLNGAEKIYVGCIHGILCGDSIKKLQDSDIEEIVVTNTVPILTEKQINKLKVISIAKLFAEIIRRDNEFKLIDDLFRNAD